MCAKGVRLKAEGGRASGSSTILSKSLPGQWTVSKQVSYQKMLSRNGQKEHPHCTMLPTRNSPGKTVLKERQTHRQQLEPSISLLLEAVSLERGLSGTFPWVPQYMDMVACDKTQKKSSPSNKLSSSPLLHYTESQLKRNNIHKNMSYS